MQLLLPSRRFFDVHYATVVAARLVGADVRRAFEHGLRLEDGGEVALVAVVERVEVLAVVGGCVVVGAPTLVAGGLLVVCEHDLDLAGECAKVLLLGALGIVSRRYRYHLRYPLLHSRQLPLFTGHATVNIISAQISFGQVAWIIIPRLHVRGHADKHRLLLPVNCQGLIHLLPIAEELCHVPRILFSIVIQLINILIL